MNWDKLFSIKRPNEMPRSYTEDRSPYDIDFDRVVFSSAFRRLQDKTQVIPLPEFDFVHSRLTHSLETSCVGRSLGRAVGIHVKEKYNLPGITSNDFGSVVAAASLAHDIGNPPFGHSGEEAISNYFRCKQGSIFEAEIANPEKWNDLINFEGNANGYRILTHKRNAQLTYTTLSAFAKYPCHSTNLESEKFAGRVSQKKYGYFQAEKESFEAICNELKIKKLSAGRWCRHPLAFLVEAADDICYRIIDFEDGVRIGLISFERAEQVLLSIIGGGSRHKMMNDVSEKIGYLRARCINQLIDEVVEQFWKNEAAILSGEYDQNLVKQISSYAHLKKIEKVSRENVYDSPSVLQIEVSGFSVVAGLLDLFITAVNDTAEYGKDLKKRRPLSANVIKLLPKQFLGPKGVPDKDLYVRILRIAEFVAGMTDTYAVTLHKRLTGIQLAHA